MRLKKEHIDRISKLILANLTAKKLITPRVPEARVLGKIHEVILTDMRAEDKLDDEARKMMDTYRQQISSGSLDERKVFQMIKKQLAKERKMIL